MFGHKWGDEYKILFVGLRTEELGLDTGKDVEGLELGLIKMGRPGKESSKAIFSLTVGE